MKKQYQLKEETRARCKIIPYTAELMGDFRILTMEHFELFYVADRIDFSLYLLVGLEIVEFIRPNEYANKELLDQVKQVMAKDFEQIYLMIRKADEKQFVEMGKTISSSRVNKIMHNDPSLDRQTIETFTDLTTASQLVVKGGITQGVVDLVAGSTSKMINHMLENKSAMSTLSRMINADPMLYDHSACVSIIGGIIATTILNKKLSTKIAELVSLCGIYHDIGKSEIANSILHKPGKLTPEEFDVIKTHTTKGYEEINRVIKVGVALPDIVARVALEHHEKFNGSGYPLGRKGKAEDDPQNGIHLISRIITVADVYSALLMKRIYKPSYDAAEALKIMAVSSGNDYDPEIFLPFLKEVVKSYDHYNEKKRRTSRGKIILIDQGETTIIDSNKKDDNKAS